MYGCLVMPSQPFLHETPTEALGSVVERILTFETLGWEDSNGHWRGDRPFSIRYPGNIDALLDHPATHQAFERDEYMPYWADLWPSAQMLAQAILLNRWPMGLRALEIGCGVGLPGVAALAQGFWVCFSDYDSAALRFAAENAIANGFHPCEQFETLPLDWRVPPAGLEVDLLLASDVIYETRNIEPLLGLIQSVLKPQGQCWLIDPNRPYQAQFETQLKATQLRFEKQAVTLQEARPPAQGTLFKIYT